MPYFVSAFGNGTDVGSGGNVKQSLGSPHNFGGPRRSGGAQGVMQVDGMIEQVVFQLDGAEINDLGPTTSAVNPMVPFFLPPGAIIRDVWYDGETVFTLAGTTPTILVGTSTSEATNGFVITQAQAQSANTARLTASLTGTWAVNTPLQAKTQVSIILGGTTPTIDRLGKARVTIEYIRPNNVVDG